MFSYTEVLRRIYFHHINLIFGFNIKRVRVGKKCLQCSDDRLHKFNNQYHRKIKNLSMIHSFGAVEKPKVTKINGPLIPQYF